MEFCLGVSRFLHPRKRKTSRPDWLLESLQGVVCASCGDLRPIVLHTMSAVCVCVCTVSQETGRTHPNVASVGWRMLYIRSVLQGRPRAGGEGVRRDEGQTVDGWNDTRIRTKTFLFFLTNFTTNSCPERDEIARFCTVLIVESARFS